MDSSFVPEHLSLGAVYENQGLLQQAIDEYKKVIELRPADPAALAALGYVYAPRGRRTRRAKYSANLPKSRNNTTFLRLNSRLFTPG